MSQYNSDLEDDIMVGSLEGEFTIPLFVWLIMIAFWPITLLFCFIGLSIYCYEFIKEKLE